ncbi:MAG TPA: universal stress protein [Gemmatimonadaceae bacterium]|jgi:nucleotide-binding universal stress UspA family protein|nr:universal stress protein [Gemmatimonadaceae bacterium]
MIRTVLVPLDGSTLAERALPVAFDIARRTGGAVHLVRAHAPLAIIGATSEGIVTQDMLAADDLMRKRAKEYLDETASRLGAEWGVRVVPHVDDGSAAGLITQVADDVLADIVVMTTHGQGGFAPGWLGSVADGVIRHSYRPVLALPENDESGGEPLAIRSIMVTLDGSAGSMAIIPPVRDLALVFGAEVHLVRVVAPYVPMDVVTTLTASQPDRDDIDSEAVQAKHELDGYVTSLEASGLRATATVLVQLSPPRALLDHVKETDPDCIAIATQGRGISRLFVGSVADKLIRSAGRPTLVLRPPKT